MFPNRIRWNLSFWLNRPESCLGNPIFSYATLRNGPGARGIEMLEQRLCLSAADSAPWQPVGPVGGTVFTLERDPFQTTTLLAGTYFGGLYRSVDQGISWHPIASPFSQLPVFSVGF